MNKKQLIVLHEMYRNRVADEAYKLRGTWTLELLKNVYYSLDALTHTDDPEETEDLKEKIQTRAGQALESLNESLPDSGWPESWNLYLQVILERIVRELA